MGASAATDKNLYECKDNKKNAQLCWNTGGTKKTLGVCRVIIGIFCIKFES